MADLFYIDKVVVGKENLTAEVVVAEGAPLMTSEDIEATARVYYLAPGIAEHLCLGDADKRFQDCMGDTELAHLLEHLTVEILNKTGLAGEIACGRTRSLGEEGVYQIELSCPDDALTIGALSSAVFMMEWAFLNPEGNRPDFDGIVEGLKHLALSLRPKEDEAADAEDSVVADGEEGAEEQAEPAAEAEDLVLEPAPAFEGEPAEVEPAVEPEAEPVDPGATVPFSPLEAEAEDEEPQGRIDIEGAIAQMREQPVSAFFGGAAASAPADDIDEPEAPAADPESTVAMPPLD